MDDQKDEKNARRDATAELVPDTGAFELGPESKDTAVDVHTQLYDGVQRKMEQRHMQMFALAGVIGTGLFLGSGKAIAHGGPVGTLLAYSLVGSVIWCISGFTVFLWRSRCSWGIAVLTKRDFLVICLGEMAVFAPISGSFIHYAERWLHPSLGFALGWQIIFQYCISTPSEVIAASILISFWDKGEFGWPI